MQNCKNSENDIFDRSVDIGNLFFLFSRKLFKMKNIRISEVKKFTALDRKYAKL